MDKKERIGEIIKNLRKRKKISQRQLSIATGLSNTAIANIEKGTADVKISNLDKIAKALGTTSDDILSQANEGDDIKNQNNSLDYKDIPIEDIEKFLEGRKMLAFKGQVLTEEQLRSVYAFLIASDEMYKKHQQKLDTDPEYKKHFEEKVKLREKIIKEAMYGNDDDEK
ncbi:helix-turn-helix domain-containing protein [Thermoanaerobacterium thermosaccharolyticum]|uniref:helix-turn-helix domain-containing protein n=1 Tax=Thermoanaerobacterium thermosaccharolyticum TaxID=1517 RepID=UPI0017808700|nr:helix-turn-helix transcriptional regulator [Thermoanaerobacterium thermosaccharolyticum]MBE0227530.1 helix-turn-helix transcriptional regulator [Thermoanaerobacterium thermosaccharolyticum]